MVGTPSPCDEEVGRLGNSQDAGAGGTHEGAHRHVGVGRAALVTVKALSVSSQTRHFPQHLQVFLFLLSFRTRRHDKCLHNANRLKRNIW